MIIQLHPDSTGHWELYQRFEKRCVDFGNRAGWPVNPDMRREMRTRWIATPHAAGYFLRDDFEAHLLSWAVINYGRLGILIYQAEGPGHVLPLLEPFFEMILPRWIEQMESVIKRQVMFVEANVDEAREQVWISQLGRFRKVASRRLMTVLELEPKEAIDTYVANGVRQ